MSFENLYVDEFKESYEAHTNAVLLDVRTPEEIAQGTIDGSININAFDADFAAKLGKLDSSKAYFVYCRSGRRSANACQLLAKQGVKELFNLEGGYMAWEDSGY